MTLEQAADLAARILARLDAESELAYDGESVYDRDLLFADRARVESDLAGLRACAAVTEYGHPFDDGHEQRYTDGLKRTADFYGVPLPSAD